VVLFSFRHALTKQKRVPFLSQILTNGGTVRFEGLPDSWGLAGGDVPMSHMSNNYSMLEELLAFNRFINPAGYLNLV
jgi:hypothetical protein